MTRIFWVLVGSRDTPSSRIHGYRVHEHLLTRGWKSEILFAPPLWANDPPLTSQDVLTSGVFQPGDIVVLQKLHGPNTVAVLKSLRSIGVSTVYLDCDMPPKIPEAQGASRVVCSSEGLAREYEQSGVADVCWIPDAYEWLAIPKINRSRSSFRCLWFGNITNEKWTELDRMRELIAGASGRWNLVSVSDHPRSEVQWRIETAWRAIADCDAVVLPASDEPSWRAKSSNKAIQAMALGVPVVAYPIASYARLIRSGTNGFLCRTDGEWLRALRALEDPDLRERVSRCGFRFARRYFSMQRIGRMWEIMFQEVAGAIPRRSDCAALDRITALRRLQESLNARVCAQLVNEVRFG